MDKPKKISYWKYLWINARLFLLAIPVAAFFTVYWWYDQADDFSVATRSIWAGVAVGAIILIYGNWRTWRKL